MTKEDKNIRISLFGFNKNEVDKYINNLEKQKVNQLEELKESIAMITTENKMWERELEELKDFLNKQLEQQEFMEYALDRAKTQIRSLIIRAAENEFESASVIEEKKELVYDEKTNNSNENSVEAAFNLENDLLSKLEINNNVSREIPLGDITEYISENVSEEKELENSTFKVETLPEEQNFQNESDNLQSTDSNISVFDVEQDFDNENAEFSEDNIKGIKDSQEEVIDENSHCLIETDNSELNLPTISVEKNDTNSNELKSSISFLEDADKIKSSESFLDEEFGELSEFEKVEELPEVKKKIEIKETPLVKQVENEDKSMDNIGFSFCNRNDNDVNKAKKSNYHEENKDKISIQNNLVENKSLESKVITGEVRNIRSKYLINKIVGEDLLDKQGNLLVRKGSIITENLIKIVDKEGKLAELILNMILPETSE